MRSEENSTPVRARGIEIRPFPAAGRLAIGADRACRHRSAMHYLLNADVTAARRLMAMSPRTLSLTGFVAVSVARAAAESPVVHAYRDWRGRLVTHRHVDVMVPVETTPAVGHEPHLTPHVVRNADTRDVAEVSTELLAAKDFPTTGIPDAVSRLAAVPGLARTACTVLDRSVRLRQRIGTVMVAATGMRHIGETFGITAPALMPLQVLIGSVRTSPHQTGNVIERHEILNLTLTFDRDVVGTAQAADFATRLCAALERAEVLQSHIPTAIPTPSRQTVSPGVDTTA